MRVIHSGKRFQFALERLGEEMYHQVDTLNRDWRVVFQVMVKLNGPLPALNIESQVAHAQSGG